MFVSPGAIRLVASVSGKPASAWIVALSQVSQRTGSPSGPGRSLDDVLERRVDAARPPAEAQRQVQHVHPEVVHDARLAAELGLALPVDRLVAVEVAGVQERVLDLDQLAERAGADRVVGELGAGEVGHLARAAGEDVRGLDRLDDAAAGGEVDAERLLAQEVLAGVDGLEVELLVQVVRDGEVEDVEVGVLEQRVAVVGQQPHALDALEPRERVGARVAHGLEPRRHRVVGERRPAPDRRRQLAAHQAAADDADPGDAHARRASASSAVAPSCTTAISACVIAAGFSCWMTLRP